MIEYGETVLVSRCEEVDGVVDRTVHKFVFTPSNLQAFWEQAKKYRVLFGEEVRDDYRKFLSTLFRQENGLIQLNGLFYMVDDMVGTYYATNIKPGLDATVHYSFFDGRHHGRVDMTKRMLVYFFKMYDFQRLTVILPKYATKKTHNFVHKSLGFKEEGRIRNATLFDGEYFDVTIFGILKDEALRWDSMKEPLVESQ